LKNTAAKANREQTVRRAAQSKSKDPWKLPAARVIDRKSSSFSATEAKNEFGRVLEKAIQGSVVVITKHDAPKAVLMSIEEFNALSRPPESKLDTLTDEFDAALAQMQRPGARNAMQAAFHASSNQLGRTALAAVRKRG
jgi:prevent-host-death family protein